jgi:anti-anti-sigma regulatory factor
MVSSGLRKPAKIFTISLSGALTVGNPVATLENAVRVQLARGVRRIRLDLRAVPFADAAGLGSLVSCREMARAADAVLTIAGARGKLREEIRLTCLDRAGLGSSGRLPADSRTAVRGSFARLAPRVA